MNLIQSIRAERRARHLPPTVALTAAGVILAISLFLPYWRMDLVTPMHPGGLHLVAYLDHLEGPLDTVLASAERGSEARLRELSELERSLAVAIGTVICLLVVTATFVHNRWAALLALPALAFPVIVVADTAHWLRPLVAGLAAVTGGPRGPSPFFVFGRLAQPGILLETFPGAGLVMATVASVTVAAGLWLHRRAYKPIAGNALAGAPKSRADGASRQQAV